VKLRVEAEDYIDQKLAAFEILLNKTLGTVAKGREQLRGQRTSLTNGAPEATSGPDAPFDAAELSQPSL
jgi:hypothetical protein